MKRKRITLSLGFLLMILFFTTFAPLLAPYHYELQNVSEKLQPPSFRHWMGTDGLGRDVLSRILYGGQISLGLGGATAGVAVLFGSLIGLFAGYRKGWIDDFLMLIADLFSIFPSPLLAILFTLAWGRGPLGIFLALAVTSWITPARLIRSMVFQVRELPYIEAAQALGAPPFRIMIRHLLPCLVGPMVASLTLQIPTNIMTESFLSFIGLGIQPPLSSWGTLASEGFRAMQTHPHLILFPGLILFLTMLALNQIGETTQEPTFTLLK